MEHFPVLMNPTHEVKVMSGCRTGQRSGESVLGVEEENILCHLINLSLFLICHPKDIAEQFDLEIVNDLSHPARMMVRTRQLKCEAIHLASKQSVFSPRILTCIVHRKFLGSQEILVNIFKKSLDLTK